MSTTDLRNDWQSLVPEATLIAKEAKLLQRVASRLSTPEGYEALKRLSKDLETLAELTLTPNGLIDRAQAAAVPVRDWLAQEWRRRSVEFAGELRTYFADRELEVAGDPPLLSLPPFELELHAEKDRATLRFSGEAVQDGIPLSTERIFREWGKARAQLERRSTAPDELIELLHEAYEQVRLLKDLKPGGRVRLSDAHFQAFVLRQTAAVRQDPRAGRIKEYPRAQFAWDLVRLQSETPTPLRTRSGQVLEFQQASLAAAKSRTESVRLDASPTQRIALATISSTA